MMYGMYGCCMMYGNVWDVCDVCDVCAVCPYIGVTQCVNAVWVTIQRIHAFSRTAQHTAHAASAVRALQCLSGSSTKAAPPAIARGAIGTSYERLQWQERADALTDEMVSCRAREMVAGAVVLAGACAVDGSTLQSLPPLSKLPVFTHYGRLHRAGASRRHEQVRWTPGLDSAAGLGTKAARQAAVACEDARACGFGVRSAERTLSFDYRASLR